MAQSDFQYIGKPHRQLEGGVKVRGLARFAGDIVLPRMLYARPVLSPYANAEIVDIDISAAVASADVVDVYTGDDLALASDPETRGRAQIVRGRARVAGETVAVVLATSPSAAEAAAELVAVTYDGGPVVASMDQALQPDGQLVWAAKLAELDDEASAHAGVKVEAAGEDQPPSNILAESVTERGDVGAGFAAADVIVEGSYTTKAVYQGYLEPMSVVADYDTFAGQLTIYTGTQGPFAVRDAVAAALKLSLKQVRVLPQHIGGGFGGKCCTIEPLAGALAMKARRPVQLVYSRAEDMVTATPSPATRINLRLGAKRDGTLTALTAEADLDCGLAGFGLGGVISLVCGSYYRIPNFRVTTRDLCTHHQSTGAYRAPAAPQAVFALESMVDELAAAIGLDPLALRLQAGVQTGDLMSNDQPWRRIGLRACLEAAETSSLWHQRRRLGPGEGIGLAIGGWTGGTAPASAICRVERDGTIRLHLGNADISGANSSLILVAAEILTVPPEQIEIVSGSTDDNPFTHPSYGSMCTYTVSAAVADAANKVKDQLLQLAATELEASREDLELVAGQAQVRGVPQKGLPIAQLAAKAINQAGGAGPIVADGRAALPGAGAGFTVHIAKVHADRETGEVRVLDYLAIQDVGRALNPLMVNGQIHGGVVQGLGWALHEAMVYSDDAQVLTTGFTDYDLPKAAASPAIQVKLIEEPSEHGVFGARGVGEPPIIPGAAAVANAIANAIGVRVRSLPITPETLWRAARAQAE